MTRAPRLTPDKLTQEQRALYDAIAGGPRASTPAFRLTDEDGTLAGPFNAMLLHPAIGDALQRLGAALRYRGVLSDRAREIAILAVAAHWRSEFERYAHERIGRVAGLTEAEIAALGAEGDLELPDPVEAAVLRTTRRLLHHRALGATEYAEAVAVLGPATLFELTTLIGYYQLLALQMRVFAVDRPGGTG